MKRNLQTCAAIVRQLESPTGTDFDVHDWLVEQVASYNDTFPPGKTFFLAHADDGVLWGKLVEEGSVRLQTSHNISQDDDEARGISPKLRAITLQQARLFSQVGEIMLWRTGETTWAARLIEEKDSPEDCDYVEAYDEPQLLWGDHGRSLAGGFTLMWDGAQGLRHIMPIDINHYLPIEGDPDAISPPKLLLRHYLAREDIARVAASRLMDFEHT